MESSFGTSRTPGSLFRNISKTQLKRKQLTDKRVELVRQANFDSRHKWIFEKVAAAFGVNASDVGDYVALNKKVSQLNAFYQPNGPRKLLWYHQPGAGSLDDTQNLVPIDQSVAPFAIRLTDGADVPLRGRCIYFIRSEAVEIKDHNIATVVVTGRVDGEVLLRSLQETLQHVLIPSLASDEDLVKETQLEEAKLNGFIDDMSKFVVMMRGISDSLHDAVVLQRPPGSFTVENKPSAYQAAADAPEIVALCEGLVDGWSRQIEDILGESDGLRRESDDVGPRAELSHWKSRMAKFNSITDQVKSAPYVKAAVGVLQAARSPRVEAWKDLDSRITDAANEAKDNVKYLYTLERFSEPLYTASPVKIVETIPGLINAIKMMHSIARYYNTSERMTSLFVKITNQMITSCKNYIHEGGDIWEQPRKDLIERLGACLTLFKAYQDAFHKTKQQLAQQPKEKQFDFSETYIFGKFQLFCQRVQKLIDMFTIVEQFATLEDSSIEDMDEVLYRFHKIYNEMKNRHYDLLDHRKLDFEAGYLEFYEKIIDLERLLQEFINASFETVTSTEAALRLLRQFKSVVLRSSLRAELENKYLLIFTNYGRELEEVRRIYELNSKDPPIPRDTPMFAGSIAWARQLLRRIESPMKAFQQHPHILYTLEAKKVLKVYNKLATALFTFETMYHQHWVESVEDVRGGLHATLLVRHHGAEERLLANFDPLISQVAREAQVMRRMDLEVPETARIVASQEAKFKAHYNELVFMLGERSRVIAMIDPQLAPLFAPLVDHLNRCVEPGLTQLTWASLSIDGYLERVHAALNHLTDVVDKANAIVDFRIRAALQSITAMSLVDMPRGKTFDIDDFQEMIDQAARSGAEAVDNKGRTCEAAAHDLVELVVEAYPRKEDAAFVKEFVDDLMEYFSVRTVDAVAVCCQLSLRDVVESVKAERKVPLFDISVELAVPEIVLDPSLDLVQGSLTQLANSIVDSSRMVYLWGQDRSDASAATCHEKIAKRPEVGTLKQALAVEINEVKKKVEDYVSDLKRFRFLWETNKTMTFEEFFKDSLTIDDFAHKLSEFENMHQDILAIPTTYSIGLLCLNSSALKATLEREIASWKQYFGEHLKGRSHRDMQGLSASMDDQTLALNRQVNDLDEVRQVMDVLSNIRENETATEMQITAIEEIYTLLNRYQITYSREDAEHADNLRYSYTKLQKLATQKQQMLISLQPGFRKELTAALAEFDNGVQEFVSEYNQRGPNIPGIKPRVAVERLKTFSRMFEEQQRRLQTYNGGEVLFGMQPTQYKDLERIGRELRFLELLYGLYTDVIMTVNGYEEILWSELDLEAIQIQVTEFQGRCKRLPKAMKEWEAFLELQQTIVDFDHLMPLLEAMSNKAVQERHWSKIMTITKHTFKLDPDTFKLKHLLEAPLLKHQDDIHEVCQDARGEADVEFKLLGIQDEWMYTEFSFALFSKTRGELILNGEKTAEIMAALEESLLSLQSLIANRNNVPFKTDIQQMSVKLNTCLREIENWQHVQSLWIYLEAVFMGGDISKALPQEKKRFTNIDNSWVKIMNSVHENPNVVSFVYGDETLRNLLPHLLEQLELCQSSLTGYLESKQKIFPRFYFLSPPALLEVLGQANSDTHAVRAHLSSVFANINAVRFSAVDYNQIVGMQSAEGEYVDMFKPLDCEGNVEDWLNLLIDAMRRTVKHIVQRGASSIATMESLEDFCLGNFAQVALLGIQLMWTEQCESSLLDASRGNTTAMKHRDKENDNIFKSLVAVTRKELKPMDRVKIETLVTIHLHQLQVFHKLVLRHIKSPEDFEWQKQTRFYLLPSEGEVVIRITDTEFKYCYEYLGCTDRLVITPLTDRCFITLAQALAMSLGGAPAGPAGTGKTETVKDMGKALGKYVVVFNCSPEHEFKQMEMIYKGICMSGCWGDFDEFNRIKLPVLSVCAAQIASIFAAKKEKKVEFVYTDGSMVPLDKECGIFITMNPGYAGRQELPENLKLQFRTVAMMVPDRRIIMEVKLASAGFLECSELATKFYWLYKLCEEQLSKQRHYDFGLRNILSVLRTCGKVKRTTKDSEKIILQRVARDMNLSKLVDDDYSLFLSLIEDLFPNSEIIERTYAPLEAAIQEVVARDGLVAHAAWKLKVIQLYETANVRWGIMVLGPSGAGKTTCINTLLGALNVMGQSYKEVRMNPKAIKPWQYLGKIDASTNEWKDGIFSALWRRYNGMLKKRKDENVWLSMDGPIDSLWIESLNTVLDDNKTLTLPNGDRLVMAANLKLVFEVDSVRNASPATVSRAGMIYMSGKALGWRPVLGAWLRTRSKQQVECLNPLFETTWDPVALFVEERCKPELITPYINAISAATTLLSGLMASSAVLPESHMNKLFVFTVMWSLGGLLGQEGRELLSRELARYEILEIPSMEEDSCSMYDYTVSDTGEWVHWNAKVPKYTYPQESTPPFYTVLVPTVSSVRTEFLIDLVAKQEKSVLLVGESGTAKTATVLKYLESRNADTFVFKTVNFSSATHPNLFQRTIEGYVVKAHSLTFKPPGQKKMMVFIDDLSMPSINEHGDQPTNEIVRQLIEQEGFYSLDKPPEFMTVKDLQFLAAMFHPGGGRNDIPDRLKRHFTAFNCTLPSAASIEAIFSKIVTGFYSNSRGFPEEVQKMSERIVPLTRLVWSKTKLKMLPTPEHFHYNFNLRDLSRITEGLVDVQADVISSPQLLLQLWKHECDRVLSDKLIHRTHKEWFEGAFAGVLKEDVGQQMCDEVMQANSYFVDFLRDEPDPEMLDPDAPDDAMEAPKVYEAVESLASLRARLEYCLQQYNGVRGQNLDLVLFEDCITHVVKVSRIIRRPRGNALLVGVGGSGKQSVTKLAAFVAGHQLVSLTMTRGYSLNNFLEDLVNIYKIAGHKGKPVTFIFTDNDIKDQSFLEYMNSVLTSGEVANLVPKDELDNIIMDLRPIMRRERPEMEDTSENAYKFFIERVRNNLHVVLCFSPVGEKFRNRALKFPGLINGCTINWFEPWPKNALIAVAEKNLNTVYDAKQLVCSREVKNEMVQFMCNSHFMVEKATRSYFEQFRRQVYVTPTSYINFITSYLSVYTAKKDEVDAEALRMNGGLVKLSEASVSVAKMQEELNIKNEKLAVAQVEAAKVLAEIKVSTASLQKEAEKVKQIKDAVTVKAEQARATAEDANAELEKAMPILHKAIQALEVINPKEINELRAGNNPVHFTQRVLECVRILRYLPLNVCTYDPEVEQLHTTWRGNDGSQTMMKQGDFLPSLKSFPKEQLNGEMIELLEPYFVLDKEFSAKKARSINTALVGLFEWVSSMMSYYHVATDIEPKTIAKKKAEKRLEIANRELAAAQAILDEKQEELRVMTAKYDAAMLNKQRLLDDATQTERTMIAATQLIEGLADEKVRWTAKSKTFEDTVKRLVGDVAVATAFVSYAGPFNQQYRNDLVLRWCKDLKAAKIPFNSDVNVISLLADDNTIGRWNIEGLPTDGQSVENGIIVTQSSQRMDAKFPLLIDPQTQGHAWIINREAANGLIRVTVDKRGFKEILENCVSNGTPLLVEDLDEEMDPLLDRVLQKGVKLAGHRNFICKVGDKEIPYNVNFRLYMTSKMPNPRYPPEVYAKASIIDFTVTTKGLEDQLLGRVIRAEKEELELQRIGLLQEVNANKQQIKDLEDNLLFRLSNTEGNLVEDDNLIQVLRNTKRTSEEVSEKLVTAEETNKKIDVAREEYRPVATRGSILYFLMSEMSGVNDMYQTSLQQFLSVFDGSIDRASASNLAATRITNIIEELTFSVYSYIARGLFEADKLLLKIQMALKVDMEARRITADEVAVFVKGGAALDPGAVKKCPDDSIPMKAWLNLVALSSLSLFHDILNLISSQKEVWLQWLALEKPEEATIPDGYNDQLDDFRRLLLIRCWCEDRMYYSVKTYIENSLGKRYMQPLPDAIESAFSESSHRTPIVCLLSLGSDPTENIKAFAKRLKLKPPLECSMGQGQEEIAGRLISTAQSSGEWMMLQNCHLGLKFLEELVIQLKTLPEEAIHRDFRLWITTEPVEKFPISLLHMAIKVTNEPPQGMMAGLNKTFANQITQDLLDRVDRVEWRPLLFSVCFMYSVIQERRKYGPLGWNIAYEFNQSDLVASVTFLANNLYHEDRGIVDWKTIQYMICECHYGGRVTDDFDRRLVNTYGKKWLSADVCSSVQAYKFAEGYPMPTSKTTESYLEYIGTRSDTDSPEIFGLHPNADIEYRTNQAESLLSSILAIQPKDSNLGGGETREAAVYRQCDALLEQIPDDFVESEVRERIEALKGFKIPLNIFLFQEVQRFQIVISRVRKDLENLKLAIDGTIILSESLMQVLNALFDGRVPPSWLDLSWKSKTLGFWMSALDRRYAQYTDWLKGDRPAKFWLAGFFNPQGFLTSVLQEYSRHNQLALDKIMATTTIPKEKDLNKRPAYGEGVMIYGLTLEGATYDRRNNKLKDLQGKERTCEMPVMLFAGKGRQEMDEDTLYRCPVYVTSRRTDLEFIVDVYLPTGNYPPQHWILRGVALIASTT